MADVQSVLANFGTVGRDPTRLSGTLAELIVSIRLCLNCVEGRPIVAARNIRESGGAR